MSITKMLMLSILIGLGMVLLLAAFSRGLSNTIKDYGWTPMLWLGIVEFIIFTVVAYFIIRREEKE